MKYIVLGGSSGLGLAISTLLSKQGNEIIIYDIKEPLQKINKAIFKSVDLSKDDLTVMKADIEYSNGLIYTAGIGKVKHFEDYTMNEIDTTISIDLTSLIKVLTLASSKLKENINYECLCISSIAGLVSSPLFSLYSAAKAGVCKYIEAVNTELIKTGSCNRITNVVATAFKGTSFNGGQTDLKQLDELAKELVDSMINKELIHKVNPELINSILKRYNDNALKFSLESYDYKINSGRI